MSQNDVILDILFKTSYEGVEEGAKDLEKLKKILDDIKKSDVKFVDPKTVEDAEKRVKMLESTIKQSSKAPQSFSDNFTKELKKSTGQVDKTNKEIKKTDDTLKKLDKTAKTQGFQSIGQAAKLATADIRGAETSIDKLRVNIEQGLGQTIAFGGIDFIKESITGAFDNVKQLDEVMTDISIVSGKTRAEMEAYRDAAGEAADILGSTTKKYLEASLIYEQQGGDAAKYAKELADATVVAANISNVATDEMSEYLTSTINGFQMLKTKGGEAGTYITDVLAKLGAASGSDLAEIATGLTRVANTARDAGYTFEEISAMVATTSEITRKSPETIGNAFKSILASFTQLKEKSTKEGVEMTSKIEEAFKSANLEISIFDDNENLRDAKDIFADIAKEWSTMSKEQQAMVATSVAGKYQMENFLVFMENQERYNDLLETAYDSAGTSANQQIIYMESIKAKTEQLRGAWETLSTKIVNTDMFKGVLEDATTLLKTFSSMGKMSGVAAASPFIGIAGNLMGASKMKDFVSNKSIQGMKVNYDQIEKDMTAGKTGEDLENTKKLIDEKRKEIEIGKERTQIEKQLGADAGKRYQEVSNYIEKLDEELALVKDINEENKRAKSEEIAQRLEKSGGMKGVDNTAITSRAREISNDGHSELDAFKNKINSARQEIDELNKIQIRTKVSREDMRDLSLLREQSKKINDLIKRASSSQGAELKEIKSELAALEQQYARFRKKDKLSNKDKQVESNIRKQIVSLLSREKEIRDELEKSQKEIQRGAEKELETKAKALAIEEQLTKEMKQQEAAIIEKQSAEQMAGQIEKAAKRTKFMTNAVKTTSTAFGALVPAISAANAAYQGTISKQEAIRTGLSGISTALISSMNPWAMLVGVVGIGANALIKHLGLFKSEAEKAKDANEALIQSVMSLKEQSDGALAGVRGIEENYRILQGMDASVLMANQSPDENTVKLQERYRDLTKDMIELFPESIKYYNEQGEAIIDLSKGYEDLVLQKEKEAQQIDTLLNTNQASFWTQYANDMEKAREKMNKAQAKFDPNALAEAKATGNSKAVNNALKAAEKLNQAIAQNQTVVKETQGLIQSNIVRPLIDTIAPAEETNKQLKNMAKNFASEAFSTPLITRLMGKGEDGRRQMEQLESSLRNITEEAFKLDKAQEGKGVEILKSLQSMNKDDLGYILRTEDITNYEQLNEQMSKLKDSMGSLFEMRQQTGNGTLFDTQKEIDGLFKATEAQKDYGKAVEDNIAISSQAKDDYINSLPIDQRERMREIYADMEESNDTQIKQAEDLADKNRKILEALTEQNKEMERGTERYAASLNSLDGIENSIQSLEQLKQLDGLFDNPISGAEDLKSVIQQISEISPELGANMSNALSEGKSAAEVFQMGLENVQLASAQMAQGLMGDNTDYFQTWMANNSGIVDELNATFDLDWKNIHNLNDLKAEASKAELKDTGMVEDQKRKAAVDTAKTKGSTAWTNVEDLGNALSANLSEEEFAEAQKRAMSAATSAAKIKDWQNFLNEVNRFFGRDDPYFKDKEVTQDAYDKALEQEIKKMQASKKLMENSKYQYVGQEVNKAIYDDIFSGSDFDFGGIGQNLQTTKDNWQKSIERQQAAISKQAAEAANKNAGLGDKAGKEKDKKEKEVKDLDLTLDRYYKLENALKRVNNEYSAIKRTKDTSYGNDKLKAMDKETDLLGRQASVIKQYVAELQKEQRELKGSLGKHGFKFDANGDIANLNERLKAMQDAANRLSGEAKEQAINNIKNIQEDAKRYTNITFNLLPDKQNALDEIKKTLSSIAKEKLEYKVQLKLDKDNFKSQLLEVIKEFQDSYSKLDEKTDITGKQLSNSLADITYWEKMIKEVQKNNALTDADKADKLKEYNSNLLNSVSKARQYYKELAAIQEEFVRQSIDAINKITDRYDKMLSKSDGMIGKIRDLYGNRGLDQINQIYDSQNDILNSQIEYLKLAQAELIRYRDSLEEGSEAWNAANDQIASMGDKIDTALLKQLDILKSKFDDFTNTVLGSFDKMFGAWGFQSAIDDFDKILAKQDKYLNQFEKVSRIGAKIKSINDEIAKSNDPQRIAELKKYRDEELQTLMQADKVSEADYERAMKLYEIKLKEMALQDRADAKRMAQLVRDENGNMTYEYIRQETADTSKEMEDLQKAKDDLMQFDSQQVRDAAKGVYDVISEYQSKLKELSSMGLDPEEYKKELEKLLSEANREIKEQQEEMNKWVNTAGKDGLNTVGDMIKNGLLKPEDLGTDSETLKGIMNGITDGSLSIQDLLSGNYQDFADSMGATTDELSSTMDKMLAMILGDNLEIVKAMMEASDKWTSTAGENVDLLGNSYDQYIKQATNILDQYNKSTGDLNGLLKDTNKASQEVINTIKKQIEAMQVSKNQTDQLTKATNNLQNKLIGANGKSGLYGAEVQLQQFMNNNLQPSYRATATTTDNLSVSTHNARVKFDNLNSSSKYAREEIQRMNGQGVKDSQDRIDQIRRVSDKTAGSFDGVSNKAEKARNSVIKFSQEISKLQGYGSIQAGASQRLTGFASGGYTGTWTGSEDNKVGKLAVLHEKELVLNKYDTENLLSAVNLQRQIAKDVQHQRTNVQNSVYTTNAKTENIRNEQNTDNSTSIVQPIINANFPDVQSSVEIEKAFEGLFAKASTYVGRND